jgi:UDPglucose 6-dehydrogenase
MKAFAREAGVTMRVVSAVIDVNKAQRRVALDKVLAALKGRRSGTVAILGLSYKPDTDDLREAPSLDLIRGLLRRGLKVRVYDPAVKRGAAGVPARAVFGSDAYDAAKGADALVVVTEWNEFRKLDLAKVRRTMRRRAIVDLRNVYDPETVRSLGFDYQSVGRS